jgi:hypothetical protein
MSRKGIAMLMAAATLTVATGCGTDKDPFAVPACAQVPVAAVRAAVTDLATVPDNSPRTGPDGAEYGHLPASGDLGRSYHCFWPASNSDRGHSTAFTVVVQLVDPQTYSRLSSTLKARTQGYLLTADSPGQGRAWTESTYGTAEWLCPPVAGSYGSQRLTVSVNHPKHPHDPAIDAKALADAIVPLVGCTGGPNPSGTAPASTTS